jgi:hypothetical protein
MAEAARAAERVAEAEAARALIPLPRTQTGVMQGLMARSRWAPKPEPHLRDWNAGDLQSQVVPASTKFSSEQVE